MCWKIKCNVPYGFGFYDNNGNEKYDGEHSRDRKIATGSGCGTYHIGVQSDNGPVANAMWQPTDSEGRNKGRAYKVFYWHQNVGGHDIIPEHFSKTEDAEWETNPNAS